jgi:tRNA(adenine34) deaminase
MLAITQACEAMGDWRLEDCTLYVTLEPCVMCCGAILNSRIPHLVFAAKDPKGGGVCSLFQLLDDPRLNHRVGVTSGVCEQECSLILTDFFRKQRALGKK